MLIWTDIQLSIEYKSYYNSIFCVYIYLSLESWEFTTNYISYNNNYWLFKPQPHNSKNKLSSKNLIARKMHCKDLKLLSMCKKISEMKRNDTHFIKIYQP